MTKVLSENNLNTDHFLRIMTTEVKQILNELKLIKEELYYIKAHMVEADTVLTSEEKQLLEDSIKNEKAGRLVSLEELKNVRNRVGSSGR